MRRRDLFRVLSGAGVAATAVRIIPSEPPIVQAIDGHLISRSIPFDPATVDLWPWCKSSDRIIARCQIWWNGSEEVFGLYDPVAQIMHVVKDKSQ